MEPADGAPRSGTGSLALGGYGLPSTGTFVATTAGGKGKIQGGIAGGLNHAINQRAGA